MKRLLVDTNVVLDVLLDRKPHAEASAGIWIAIETARAEGYLAAHAVATIHYLLQKELGSDQAKKTISLILRVFQVASVDSVVFEEALRLPFGDFEDAVTAAAAQASGCEILVTRDPKGFRRSPIRAITPEGMLPMIR